MAPLGIITAFVSVMRVAGDNLLKVLVGRATENLVQAELELMSSTSKESCDLWNGRALVRTLGRPKVNEIIYAPKDAQDVSPEAFITIHPSTYKAGGPYELSNDESRKLSTKSPSQSAITNRESGDTAGHLSHDLESQLERGRNDDSDIQRKDLIRGLQESYMLPPNISLQIYGRSTTKELACVCIIGALAQTSALV